MTEQDLQALEEMSSALRQDWRENVCRLVAEVRRLQKEAAQHHEELQRVDEALSHERQQKEMRHQAWLKAKAGTPEVINLLRKIKSARTVGGCSTGEAMSKSECWAREALEILDPQPKPMCKPDALEDLFPPNEGRPT